MMRRCAERAAAAGASQSGLAGSGTGSSRTPPGRTEISPAGSRCEQRPTGRKRLRNTHQKHCGQTRQVSEAPGYDMLWEILLIRFYFAVKLEHVMEQVKQCCLQIYYYGIILLLKHIRLSCHQAFQSYTCSSCIILNIGYSIEITLLTISLNIAFFTIYLDTKAHGQF